MSMANDQHEVSVFVEMSANLFGVETITTTTTTVQVDFQAITFEKGTRLHVVQLQFKQQVPVVVLFPVVGFRCLLKPIRTHRKQGESRRAIAQRHWRHHNENQHGPGTAAGHDRFLHLDYCRMTRG